MADSFIIRAVNSVSNLGTKNIHRIFAWQGVMTAVIAVVMYFTRHEREALSALLGGVVAILPAFIFAKVLFRHRGARLAKKIVNDFYLGEGIKIVVAIVLFALVFRLFHVSAIVFFATYSGIAMSFGFLLLIFGRARQKRPCNELNT